MNPQDAIDFSREALKTCMIVGGPILVASLLIGLLIGVIQAITQVQDQTVSFVPKILLLLVLIGLCLPWLTDRMTAFAKQSFEKPMTQWSGATHRGLFPKQIAKPNSGQTKSVAFSRPTDSAKSNAAKREQLPSETFRTDAVEPAAPMKSPFILPHYRMSKASKPENGG